MTVATKEKKKPAKTALKLQPLGDRVVVECEESEGAHRRWNRPPGHGQR